MMVVSLALGEWDLGPGSVMVMVLACFDNAKSTRSKYSLVKNWNFELSNCLYIRRVWTRQLLYADYTRSHNCPYTKACTISFSCFNIQAEEGSRQGNYRTFHKKRGVGTDKVLPLSLF